MSEERNKEQKLPPKPVFKYVGKVAKTGQERNGRDKKIDRFLKKMPWDDICPNICVLLLAKKKLRFNELHRSLGKLGIKISKPTLSDHLRHLLERRLVKRKVEDVQNVSYSLSNERIFDNSKDVQEWEERLENFLEPFEANKYYGKLSDKQLEQKVNEDLEEFLQNSLLELKAVVNYDLSINENESDAEFWKFIGNPLYRLLEKSIAQDCRESEAYRKKFFEKLESLVKSDTLMKRLSDKSGT